MLVSPELMIAEKKRIKKSSSCFGMACIFYFLMSFLINFIAVLVIGFLKKYSDISSEQISVLANGILYFFATVLPLPISFALFARLDNVDIRNDIPYGIRDKKSFFVCLGAMPLLMYIANLVFSLINLLFEYFGINIGRTDDINLGNSMAERIFMLFIIAVLTPFVEEFAFRGVALAALRRYGDKFAIFVTAAVFGALHGSPFNACVAFVIGLFFGYAVIKSGSIWVSIILHVFNNLIVIVIKIITESDGSDILMVFVSLGYFAVILTLFATAFAFYFADGRRALKVKLNDYMGILNTGHKLIALISVPSIIAVILIFSYSGIAQFVLANLKSVFMNLLGI